MDALSMLGYVYQIVQPALQMGQPNMPVIQQVQARFPSGQPTGVSGSTTQPGNTGLTGLPSQATPLPHAFNTATLQDPTSGA
ncbi:hypothetical protein Tco_0532370 [Tanacetum coccineum]